MFLCNLLIFTLKDTKPAFLLGGCGVQKPAGPVTLTIPLELKKLPPANQYINMDYGIRLNVLDKRANPAILHKYDVKPGTRSLILNTYPDVLSFASESMRQYMQTLGFVLDADINTDYMMQVDITQFHVSLLSGMGWVGTVSSTCRYSTRTRRRCIPARLSRGGRAIITP